MYKKFTEKGSENQIIMKNEGKEWSIWLTDIEDQIARPENCDHLFWYICILNWWKVTNKWPLCKVEFLTLLKLQ